MMKNFKLAILGIALFTVSTSNFAAPASEPSDRTLFSGEVAQATNNQLLTFFPAGASQLLPGTALDDKASWLARVNGLLSAAPDSLQQSLLTARDSKDFSTNLRLLRAVDSLGLGDTTASFIGARAATRKGDRAKFGSSDLVYRPIASCRIYDSRNALASTFSRGPLVGNVAYNFKIYTSTNFSAYNPPTTTNCGIPANSDIDAIVLQVNVLNANINSYLSIGDTATVATLLQTAAMQYTIPGYISSTVVALATSLDDMYIAFPTGFSGNVAIEAVGYFIRPGVPRIYSVAGVTGGTLSAGSAGFFAGGACTAGDTPINGSYEYSGSNAAISESVVSGSNWEFYVTNNSASQNTGINVRTICWSNPATP
jgi:hypothetical protein